MPLRSAALCGGLVKENGNGTRIEWHGRAMVFGHHIVEGTDLELAHKIQGGDPILSVNKGGVLVFRAKLRDAVPAMPQSRLARFNSFAPDFVFTIGDTEEGLRRMLLTAGTMDVAPLPRRDLLAWLRRAS
jgi:hypothetical protein